MQAKGDGKISYRFARGVNSCLFVAREELEIGVAALDKCAHVVWVYANGLGKIRNCFAKPLVFSRKSPRTS